MKKIVILFVALLAGTAHAADRLTCQTAGIVTKCPADASLAAGSVLQTAFVPWSAAPAGSIPNSALVTTPPVLSSGTPSAIGTAAPGVGTAASRFDHVHALPSVGSAGTYAYPISITTDAQGRATGITAGSAPQASSADLTALASFGLGLGIPVRTATTPTWSISTTLSGITISCTSNSCSDIANAALINSSITVTAGAGLTDGGVVALGGSIAISMPNTGPGAGAIAYPASVTLDAQGRVTAATAGSAPAALSSTTPAADSVSAGAVGVGTTAARADHAHLIPTGTSAATVTVGNDARLPPTPTTAGKIPFDTGAGYSETATGGTTTTVLHGGTTPAYGAVSLTADVSGINPVANGGTNSSSALNNNRVVVSSAGQLVETASTCPSGTMLGGGSPPDCTQAGTLATNLTTPRVDSTAGLILNAATGNDVQLRVNGTTVVNVASTLITAVRSLDMTGQVIKNVGAATTAGDALSLPWVTATNGSASLSSSPYIVASGSYASIGLALSLPSAGTYLLTTDLRTVINASVGAGGFIECQLYNTTDAAAIANSERIGAYENAVALQFYGQISINEIVTVASAKTIDVQCLRTGATSYNTAAVYSDTNGRSRFNYVKVSP